MRARVFLLSFLAALTVAVPSAWAAKPTPQPLQVSGATFTQNAQQLSWAVQLTRPFSPGALAHDGRSLCLLLERSAGEPTAQMCVAGPKRGAGAPRVTVASVKGKSVGRARFVTANVTRKSSSQLTATFLPAAIGIGYTSTRWQVSSTLNSPPCAAKGSGVVACQTLFPARPALAKFHVPKLVGCVPSGARFVTAGPSNEGKVIALTFDDGPWVQTPQFLNLLEHYHVHATFFEIGENISTYGEGGAIERRMLADGDIIGDHTWNHADVSGGGTFASDEIVRAAAAIKSATRGFEPCLFRAPGGAVSPALFSVAGSLGFKTIQWDIDPRDWSRPGTSSIENTVLGNAHPGAIVLQHDGGGDRSETLAALPDEIKTLRRRGYRFVTITQLFGMRLLYR